MISLYLYNVYVTAISKAKIRNGRHTRIYHLQFLLLENIYK